jgi:hypothetical protein
MPSAAADKCIISHIGGYTSDHAEYPRCFGWLRRRWRTSKALTPVAPQPVESRSDLRSLCQQ